MEAATPGGAGRKKRKENKAVKAHARKPVIVAPGPVPLDARNKCSPARDTLYSARGTCLTDHDVAAIAKAALPAAHVDEPMQKPTIMQKLRRALARLYGHDESKWPAAKSVAPDAFRPAQPREWRKNHNTWLTDADIAKVMRQYEPKHPDFMFIGVFAMDFDTRVGLFRTSCVADEMCRFDVKARDREGKRRFAAILNLDTHDESGSHWVAIFFSTDPRSPMYGIYYFDSTGSRPTPEALAFMARVRTQVQKLNPREKKEFLVSYNDIRKQYGNTECGVFTMYFVICCLQSGADFATICRETHTDERISELRDVLYTP
jgi:hypothetical protein